jgi:hypothetical protein
MSIKHELHELVKDVRYYFGKEKVDVDSMPKLNPASPENVEEIQKEMTQANRAANGNRRRTISVRWR